MDNPMISPNHSALEQGLDQENWPFDFMVDVFFDRIDGWHLDIAQHVLDKTRHGGWAALQIAIYYFEVAGFFTCHCTTGSSKERFRQGFCSVFPEWQNQTPDVADFLWEFLRNRLYHTGVRKRKKVIRIKASHLPVFHWDEVAGLLVIDPHKLVPRMRAHLQEYVEKLRDINNAKLREVFEEAFKIFYQG
jgi:hypothetical protein